MLQFWLDFISNLLRKDDSSQVAAGRLKGAVVLDRLSVTPAMMESIRNDVVKTISRYLVIDESAMTLAVQAQGRTVALAASIPVLRPRPDAPTSMTMHPTISIGTMSEPEHDVEHESLSSGAECATAVLDHSPDQGGGAEGSPSVRIIVQDRSRARTMRRRRQQQMTRRTTPGERPSGLG